MHQYNTLDDTVYFWFAANDTAGSGADGATPLYDVRLAGAAANAAPVLSGSPVLLTHADYPAGCHELAIAATTGNGFAANNVYAVFCTLLVDSQNPSGLVGSFSLKPVVAALPDWVDGGRLDLILDIIAADTTTDIPALINDLPTNAELATALGTADDAILAVLGTPANLGGGTATIAGNLIDIEAQTDDIGTAGAGLTALATAAELAKVPKSDSNVSWNATALAAINAEVDTALTDINLDHLIKVAKDTNWATTVTKESVIDLMTSKDANQTYDRTTDAQEATRDALTVVSAGVSATITATANTETTGTLIANTYASTYLSNGTYYTVAPVTPAVGGYGLNAYLTFGAASGQYINSVTIRGYFSNATGSARFCHVGAYNYVSNGIDVLSDSTSRMNHATANATYTYALLSAHQKADGEVRIYFLSPSTTTGDRLYVDQVLVNVNSAGASAADIAAAVKQNMITLYYPDGVWIDTVNGTDGTVTGVNGIQTFPVKTIASAYALCASLGLRTIHFTSGSNVTPVTLTQSAAGWTFLGGGKIDLGSQSIADAVFADVYSIYGISTGDDATFYNCGVGSGGITLDHAYLTLCRLKGAMTLIANADPIIFQDCIDATGAASDFELIFVANATAVLRNLRGAVTLKDMAATNSVVIDGALRVTIDATSTAGSITVRGFAPALTGASTFTTAPNTGTITQDARFSIDAINAEVDSALNTAIPGSPTADSINERMATMDTSIALMRLLIATGTVVDDNDPDPTATAFETDLAEASNDHYNGAFLVFTSGALLGQSRLIAGYVGATKIITTSEFTEAPAGGNTFAILGRSE